jgi:universal stress protein E
MLARAGRAEVELFHAIDEPDPERSFPETATLQEAGTRRAAIVEKYLRRLESFARDPALRGMTVRCTAAWDYPPHEAIIRRALATRSDLVIAAARGHRFGARIVLRNTDWELIRHCPVPLLLIKSPRRYHRPLVLAAVDPFHRHARPANLDARLLQAGGDLARLLHGRLEMFHAYMPLVSLESMVTAAAPPVLVPPEAEAAHRQQVARVVGALADHMGISRKRCHLRMGEVTDQLADFARRSGTAIVVMGAVSRSALARLFIGNAAERTLDHLSCDVLIVKPGGFRTAVQRQVRAVLARRARGAPRPGRGRRKLAQTAGALPAVPPPFL